MRNHLLGRCSISEFRAQIRIGIIDPCSAFLVRVRVSVAWDFLPAFSLQLTTVSSIMLNIFLRVVVLLILVIRIALIDYIDILSVRGFLWWRIGSILDLGLGVRRTSG